MGGGTKQPHVDSVHRTVTTTALLELLAAGDASVWDEFDERYRPILFHIARHIGLDDEDAADAAQEAMIEFFRDYTAGRYDRSRGRLRGWLLAIARNRARDRRRGRGRRAADRGDSALVHFEEPKESELERVWAAEVAEEILRRAFKSLRQESEIDERSLSVFEDYAVHGHAAADVATRYGVSISTVYSVKSRCVKRLGELRVQIEAVFDDTP